MTHKEKAIELMKKLDICQEYIDSFEKDDKVCLYENFGGYWTWQFPKLQEKLQQIEKKYGIKVYAVTHELTNIGEFYNFLIVPKLKTDWHNLVQSNGNHHIAYAYTCNNTDNYLSEFGSILVKSFGGGVKRVA